MAFLIFVFVSFTLGKLDLSRVRTLDFNKLITYSLPVEVKLRFSLISAVSGSAYIFYSFLFSMRSRKTFSASSEFPSGRHLNGREGRRYFSFFSLPRSLLLLSPRFFTDAYRRDFSPSISSSFLWSKTRGSLMEVKGFPFSFFLIT